MEDTISSCQRVPSHQHIHVWSVITGVVEGIPQRDIQALQVSYILSPGHWIVEEVMSLTVWTQWRLSCFPSPPQSPLLTFLSTQDHQKPGKT
ncbi:hypothetical protein FQN60_017706, partial [Etheostoma spectabile]